MKNVRKLEYLAFHYGYTDYHEMVDFNRDEQSVPGICTRDFCYFAEIVPRDEDDGYCMQCDEDTVVSYLVMTET